MSKYVCTLEGGVSFLVYVHFRLSGHVLAQPPKNKNKRSRVNALTVESFLFFSFLPFFFPSFLTYE